MRVLGLDHVSVTTADIERSLAFYRDLLEIPLRSVGEIDEREVERLTGVAGTRMLTADLDLGAGQILELLEYVGAGEGRALAHDSPGSGHIGLIVDDLDEVHRRIAAAEVTVSAGPMELTEPADWAGARCLTVLDPDGVSVELVQRSPRLVDNTGSGGERVGGGR